MNSTHAPYLVSIQQRNVGKDSKLKNSKEAPDYQNLMLF